jgi:hypothetical protein
MFVITKPTYRGIRRFKIKEIPFREDFPCHSTWKRCKHSGHFSRFRNIIGNFCIIKQKCLCNYVINIILLIRFLRHALTSQILKNQQKIATEQIKTATRSKLITFKTRESQNKALKMKNRKFKCFKPL